LGHDNAVRTGGGADVSIKGFVYAYVRRLSSSFATGDDLACGARM
jgi:hypothetical protein